MDNRPLPHGLSHTGNASMNTTENRRTDVVPFPDSPPPGCWQTVSAVGGGTSLPASRGIARLENTPIESPAPEQDWLLLQATHPNALIIGADSVVNQALSALRNDYRQPAVTVVATNPLTLPSRDVAWGTLILRDVLGLSLNGQQQLLAWLDNAHADTQVIATADQSPWPDVERGAFLSALYYRLNIVYVDLT